MACSIFKCYHVGLTEDRIWSLFAQVTFTNQTKNVKCTHKETEMNVTHLSSSYTTTLLACWWWYHLALILVVSPQSWLLETSNPHNLLQDESARRRNCKNSSKQKGSPPCSHRHTEYFLLWNYLCTSHLSESKCITKEKRLSRFSLPV